LSIVDLNKPYILKRSNVCVKNRIVLAAMTNKQSNKDGTLSDDEIKWLVRRAIGGFGIITTAAAHVSKDGQGWEGELGLFDDNHLNKLRELTKLIHGNKSIIFAQLFHGGMRSPQNLTGVQPLSASKIKTSYSFDGFARRASKDDIKKIINNFKSAAVRCVKAGFDGIEIHGAHGYLISQFLGSKTNTRRDEWGGDIKNRSKFLIEIYHAIKENVPDNFIVGIRISPEIEEIGIRLQDSLYLAGVLSEKSIDFLHLSCWDIYSNSIEYNEDSKTLTQWFTRTISNLPDIISTGNIWSTSDATNTIKQGASFIGVARAAIAYPDWALNLSDKRYNPSRGPFTVEHLKNADLNKTFIDYMKKWKNFVV